MPLTAELRRRTSKYYFKLLICVFIYRVLTVNSQPRPKSTLIIMTAIILPHELIYQIIDEVYDQNSTDLATMTLTSCSLTAHKFLHHCRQLIFRHIRVIISPPANPWAHRRHRSRLGSLNTSKSSPARSHLPTCRKFHYLLEASPHIASYVRGLTIIDHSSGVSTETFEEEMLPVMMNKLTLLSALHIRWSRRGISTPCRWNVGPETFKHAVSATLQLPTMTHLTLGGMCFDAGSLAYLLSRASSLKHLDLTMAIVSQDEGSIPALHTGVTPQLLYPQLESLALPYRDYLSVLEDFLSLKPPPARATLRKLCVSPEPETLVPTWNFLRSAVGGFLQHLVIFGVIIPDLQDNTIDLMGFRSLRSIQMELSDDSGMSSSDWTTSTWLAGLFAACEPENWLEEIRLTIFFDSVFEPSSSPLNKLDDILSGPKMASLRELHITLMHRRSGIDLGAYIRSAMPRVQEKGVLVIRDRFAYTKSGFHSDWVMDGHII